LIPGLVKPNTIKLVYVVSPLSMQHEGLRAKSCGLWIRTMCLEWINMFTPILLFQWDELGLALYYPTKCAGLVHSGHHQ